MKDLIELIKQIENKYPDLKPTQEGFSQEFSHLIFSTRINKGWTQAELAEKASVDINTIYRIEGGSGGITEAIYKKVLEILGLNYDEIVDYLNKG